MAAEIKEHAINKARACVNELFDKIYTRNRIYTAGLLIAIDKNFLVETHMSEVVVDYKGADYWEFYQELVGIIGKSFTGNYCIELWNEYNLGSMNMHQALKAFIMESMNDKNKEKFKG